MPERGSGWRRLSSVAQSGYLHGVAAGKGGHCVRSLQEFLCPNCKGIEHKMGGGGRQELAGTKGWVWLYEGWEVKLPLPSIVL